MVRPLDVPQADRFDVKFFRTRVGGLTGFTVLEFGGDMIGHFELEAHQAHADRRRIYSRTCGAP